MLKIKPFEKKKTFYFRYYAKKKFAMTKDALYNISLVINDIIFIYIFIFTHGVANVNLAKIKPRKILKEIHPNTITIHRFLT